MPFYISHSPILMFCMYNLIMNPSVYTQFPQISDHVLRTFDMIHPYGHYTNQTSSFDKIRNDMLDASLNAYDLMPTNDVRASCCNAFDTIETQTDNREVTFYSDNIPFTFQHYEKPKTTIFDLDRLIFPEDPIRDWVDKKVSEINAKYAWSDKIYI